jgi:hypothetical protein
MALNPEPVGIVECAAGNPAHAGSPFGGPGDGGPAARAEFHAQPAIAFVGPVLVPAVRRSSRPAPV